ncbi:O-antigen ligase family protein [Flavobacteriaceae bacterium]|nr:O-antigen ligase family protein [Flavobacteriaceae bacterium]
MYLNRVLIYLYVFIGLVPYLEATDKIHPQTLYLSILNVISISLIINKIGFKHTMKSFLSSIGKKPAIFYFVFIVFCLVSLFQSYNLIQSYLALTEIHTQFLAFLILIYLLSTIDKLLNFFTKTIVILAIVELASTFIPYFYDIIRFGSPVDRSLDYRGVTGSVNILSYLLLMKLPFLFYLGLKANKNQWLYIILSTFSLYSITVINQTRSAILLSLLVIIFMLTVFIYNSYVDKTNRNLSSLNLFKVLLLPAIIVVMLSNIQFAVFDKTASVQSRISSININEYSTNSRIRYFSQAFNSIINKPLGVGLGNWQIESVKADSQNMKSYIVPYHVHNDFLELSAEIGLLGAIAYYMVILSVFLFLLQKIITSIKKRKPLEYELLFLVSIGVYIIDSMVNFPFGRVLQQINLLFIIAVLINLYKFKTISISYSIKKLVLLIIIFSIPLVIYSSSRLFVSSLHQKIMLSHYNLGDFSLKPEDIDNFDMDYSDLTVTTIPMKSLKGFFYMKDKRYREAIDLFNEGSSRNPNLYFSESYKSYSFLNIDELDSAYYYSKLAFNKIPGNVVHFAHYAISLTTMEDSVGLKEAYNKAKFKTEIHDEIYLTSMADIINKDDSNFLIDDFDFNVQSDNDNLRLNYYTLKIGKNDMYRAAQLNEFGNLYFERGDFASASWAFDQASQINPYELPYLENYANSQLQLGQYDEAITLLKDLIEVKESNSIKARYMLVLAYLNTDDKVNACQYIEEIKDDPLTEAIELERFCN